MKLGIAIVALFACFAAAPDTSGPALRQLALTSPASNFGPAKPHQPFAVVMDIAGPKGVVSVLATANGGAGLYLSTGGAITIAGRRDAVRKAALEMIEEATTQIGQLKPAKKFDYPQKGNVSFFIRTPEGTFIATVPEPELRGRQHPLSPLYAAVQKVITELRRFPMSK